MCAITFRFDLIALAYQHINIIAVTLDFLLCICAGIYRCTLYKSVIIGNKGASSGVSLDRETVVCDLDISLNKTGGAEVFTVQQT